MAMRYCGDLRISMKIDDADKEGWLYHCTISCPICECVPKCKPYKIDIRLAVSERRELAENNPLAFDRIAKSALNFALADQATEDCGKIIQHGASDEEGFWVISRKWEESWGPISEK